MDWDNLQVFLTIARTGRVSAAARRLEVEHTTVSRRLEVLEKELGVPLFYRTTTGYLLTPHGKNVVASAETMERAAIAVAGRAREGSGAGYPPSGRRIRKSNCRSWSVRGNEISPAARQSCRFSHLVRGSRGSSLSGSRTQRRRCTRRRP